VAGMSDSHKSGVTTLGRLTRRMPPWPLMRWVLPVSSAKSVPKQHHLNNCPATRNYSVNRSMKLADTRPGVCTPLFVPGRGAPCPVARHHGQRRRQGATRAASHKAFASPRFLMYS